MTRTETITTIRQRNVTGTTAATWDIYASAAEAKRNGEGGNPVVAAWRGGYITAPAGHPIPDGARIVASRVCGKWR